jgi:hypothetical protein
MNPIKCTCFTIQKTLTLEQPQQQGHALVKATEATPGQIVSEALAKIGAIALAKAEAGAKWALDAVVKALEERVMGR